MVKFKFEVSSDSKVVNANGIIKQNGFNSFKLVPVNNGSSFGDMFDDYFNNRINPVVSELNDINSEATNIKNTVIDLSNNLTTNYLSEAELFDPDTIGLISSSIAESTATFVTTEQAGQWYGLELTTDVNGKKYITGFDIGALVTPESGTSDSYFRINADRFIVGGDIGDGSFTTPVGPDGEPIPAFSIVQNGSEPPQMYFNGKVNIGAVPTSITKMIGNFTSLTALNLYLQDNPGIKLNPGDSYKNTTENIMYFWDGDEWISAEGKISYRSIVFKRSNTKPATPTGGNYHMNVPSGWSDGIPPHPPGWTTGTAVTPVWASYTEFDNKTDYTTNPPVWTEPILTLDSATTDYIYHSSLTTPPTPTNTTDDTSIIQADINNGWYNNARLDTVWAAVRHKQQGIWTAWEISKIKGENGTDGLPGSNGSDGRRGSLVGRGSSSSWPSGSTLTNVIRAIPGSNNSVYAGDTVIWTNTSTSGGTEIYEYNGSSWGTNTALKVNGNAVISGTLYSDRIMAGHIGSAVTALASNTITATDTYPNENWTGGTTVGSISYTNSSSSYASILIIVSGRTGAKGEFSGGSCAFKIFRGSTQIYNYGWTPSGQDSKSFATTVVMAPKSTSTFYIKAVKDSSDASLYWLGANLQISIIGVANGG